VSKIVFSILVSDRRIYKTNGDKTYQLLVHGRWLSPRTPAYSTTTTGRHDIAEILLNVALRLAGVAR
jgi:hypothetical protein